MNLITINHDLQPSKKMAAQLRDAILFDISQGNISTLESMARLKCLNDAVEDATKIVKEIAIEELYNSQEQSVKVKGTTFTKCEVGTKYDFSNNQLWCKLNAICEAADKERKALEDKLKKIEYGHSIVNEVTGEVISAPIKTSISSFKILLPK